MTWSTGEPVTRDTAPAMARNLELADEVFAAIARRDLDRLLELTDPDVEWYSFFAQLGEGGVYRGHAGTERYIADLSDAWEISRVEMDDTIAIGDVVLGVGRLRYKGRGSGVETGEPAGWILKFRSRRVLLFRAFRDPERVLSEVGRRD